MQRFCRMARVCAATGAGSAQAKMGCSTHAAAVPVYCAALPPPKGRPSSRLMLRRISW